MWILDWGIVYGAYKMKVLVACEESQEVCKAFRKLGHEAFSCDVKPCSGGHPEWHLEGDVSEFLYDRDWDLMIAHPPCTRLCNSGVRWLDERDLWKEMAEAALFFKRLMYAPIAKIVIENPIPHKYAVDIIGKNYDQLIQPWQFGHGETKATCLWLKNVPKLKPTDIVEGRENRIHKLPPSKNRAMLRSKTYPGIAKAMAEQWGNLPCTNNIDEEYRVSSQSLNKPKGCGKVIRMDDGYGWINCGDKLSENEVLNPDKIELCDSCNLNKESKDD